jgi:hypothetical protein
MHCAVHWVSSDLYEKGSDSLGSPLSAFVYTREIQDGGGGGVPGGVEDARFGASLLSSL